VLVHGLLLLVALVLAFATHRLDAFIASPFPLSPPLRFAEIAGLRMPPPGTARLEAERIPVEYTLGRGETLSDVVTRLDLPRAQAREAVEALAEHLDMRRLPAGESYVAYFDEASAGGGSMAALEWTLGNRGRVVLDHGREGWRSRFVPFDRRVEIRSVSGRLETSLIESMEEAGASAILAYRMADVLQWDLDFTRDLRRGDRFEVLFEEVYLDGESRGVGGVLALVYTNAGRRLEAFRFGDENSYYDGEGRPLRKMFLRSPLRYSRITSRFSHRRFHPILKTHRPHYGVDYGAPVGTPVRVTAHGVVTFAGRDGGAGRMVKVRHPNGYITAYLHLSRFASGVRSGARVRQGEVIGYVGTSGLSTGPHLDYRVQRGGRWIDPLSLRSEPAEPLAEESREEFRAWRDALRASLDLGAPLEMPAPETPRTELEGTRLADTPPAPELFPSAAAGR
jgi:murein DD-endopeptidase MepM/ murein hydrolase activator NlpD